MASKPPEYSYVAYIDEAGDPGLNKVAPRTPGGSSEWIVVSAALIPAELEGEVGEWIADLMKAMNSHQMRDLHFQKLNANRKSLACTFIAERNVRLFAVVSNKQNMEGYQNARAAKVPSDNWFYCWLTRVLLERVTDYVYAASVKRYGESRKVKIEYSERGGLRYSQMHAYYEWLRIKSASGKVSQFLPLGDFQYSALHPDLMRVHNHADRDGLKLPTLWRARSSKRWMFIKPANATRHLQNCYHLGWRARRIPGKSQAMGSSFCRTGAPLIASMFGQSNAKSYAISDIQETNGGKRWWNPDSFNPPPIAQPKCQAC